MKTAIRPCFYISKEQNLYEKQDIKFEYFSGFSKEQKARSIKSFHKEIMSSFPDAKILEISRASSNPLGQKLSAFNLTLTINNGSQNITSSVERLFQGSKVFERGGAFEEIIYDTNIHPKRYEPLKNSGNFKGFCLFGVDFATNPTNYFYDWLYILALKQNQILAYELLSFTHFTDIEFNPQKSLSCQAKTSTMFVAMKKANILDEATENKDKFLNFLIAQG